MNQLDKAYNKVRKELAEVGLLAEGFYLDHVEVCVSTAPSEGEAGYVFEYEGSWSKKGYRPGVIYLPSDMPYEKHTPGSTLVDTIRHEYAHAWYFTDPSFFRDDWFSKTFGASYNNCNPKPHEQFRRLLTRNKKFQQTANRCRTEQGMKRLTEKEFRRFFITDYASTCACEDFAETFMFYLKYRDSLGRFESRPTVYRKLRAVERAISRARRRRHLVCEERWGVRWA